MRLLKKLLADEWIKILSYTVAMSLIAVVQVAFWPYINKMVPMLESVLPKFMSWMVKGLASDKFIFFTVINQFMKNVGFFGGFLAVTLGASAISREREAGTLEFLMAHPISRIRVLVEKYLFNFAALALPVILSTMLTWPTALFYNEVINPWYLLISAIYALLVMAILYSMSFCIGVFIDDQMKTISFGIGIALVMFALSVFRETRNFSIFGYFETDYMVPILTAGYIPFARMAVFALISIILFAVSFWKFRKLNI